VGKRENGKMIRIYEKGMQLGDKLSPWVRWEVEMHNVDRFIPWEVLLEPGKYVAGAYPKALSWVNDEMLRIKTVSETTKISYSRLTHFAGVAYGSLINVMLQVEGSAEKVIEKLIKDGIPKRLDLPVVPKGEGRSK
jgi:phage replication initiation protein